MPKKKIADRGRNEVAEILRDMLIAQLGAAGVAQKSIRQIAGCDIGRVNRIVKHLKSVGKPHPRKRT